MSIFENPPQESTKKESTSIFEKAFSFLKSLFRKDLRNLKENIENAPEATEVADVAFEDFKNSLLAKKTTNGEGKEKPFYSAQLLGTVNFFGETLLKPILEHEYEGNLLDKFLDEIKQHTMDSLLNSRVSEEEKTAFWADFEEYRIHVRERIHTKDDLAALKNGNVKLTQEYETTVNTQLEEQVQTKVSTDRQQYIDEQKKLNTSWTEASLVATGRIGTIPKSNPKSEPFERSASWTTLCSKTAWSNAQHFGINLPRGNARDAVSSAPISSRFQLAVKDTHPLKTEQFSHLAPEANFVDLSVESHSAAGKKYGHRAVAYLNQADHKWYVLDPYTGEKFWIEKSTPETPIPLEEYREKRPVLQANFYKSEYYVV